MSVSIIHVTVGEQGSESAAWLEQYRSWFSLAIGVIPFAGIFFLWFIGVARARLGRFEDQFFSTVFTGSGLLFLALIFVAAGVAGTMVEGYARDAQGYATSESYYFARDLVSQVFAIYALRMAAVFLLSQATLWWRTKVMPRWITLLTVPTAVLLLFVFTTAFWVVLVFPAWVFLVSAYLLIASFLHKAAQESTNEVSPTERPADV